MITLMQGDCIEAMRTMPDASVDAVVTDPPYGLGFMGKAWDALPPGEEWAAECLRVLKPGGHLLAFGGTRTWHRLAVAVEDAGFELRDSIAWLYGSGFPKSLDVSKAIDKLDATEERRARALRFTAWMRSTGITARAVDEATGTNMGGHYLTDAAQPAVAVADLFDLLRPLLPDVPADIEELVAERTVESQNYAARAVTGLDRNAPSGWDMDGGTVYRDRERRDNAHTDAAREWQGWGTALKPAFEPIVVGRKPLIGTVAANVLMHGTGALNIDGCRIGMMTEAEVARSGKSTASMFKGLGSIDWAGTEREPQGRWPANVVLDPAAAAELDAQSGVTRSGTQTKPLGRGGIWTTQQGQSPAAAQYGDTGGASRFFYVAKAPARERPQVGGKGHPTVKPLTLMRWLVRLVTPPGGVVLEPFLGSGTTAQACELEGLDCIGIERDPDYLRLTLARLTNGVRA